MSEKQLVRLEGKCEWAQVYPGQERAPHPEAIKKGASPNDRSYAITVEITEEINRKLRKAGLNAMHQPKYKEDDTVWLTIKGTKHKETTSKGPITFEDPAVVDANGNPFKELIGNDSVVIVEATLEQAGQAKALRLKKVTVLEHVVYVKPEEDEVTTLIDNSDSETKVSQSSTTKTKTSGNDYF